MPISINRVGFRRSLVRFSSSLVGIITVVGIMSLFSIWSMNRAYINTENVIEKSRNMANEGLLAEIDFKVQVQEWKNILLRGSDQSSKTKYIEAFEAKEVEVERHLQNLITIANELNLNEYRVEADNLIAQHKKLATTYRQALTAAPDLETESVKAVDKIVFGIDRELESNINRLSFEILTFNKTQRQTLLSKLSDRYITLRSTMLIIIAFSLIITATSLYAALRATREL